MKKTVVDSINDEICESVEQLDSLLDNLSNLLGVDRDEVAESDDDENFDWDDSEDFACAEAEEGEDEGGDGAMGILELLKGLKSLSEAVGEAFGEAFGEEENMTEEQIEAIKSDFDISFNEKRYFENENYRIAVPDGFSVDDEGGRDFTMWLGDDDFPDIKLFAGQSVDNAEESRAVGKEVLFALIEPSFYYTAQSTAEIGEKCSLGKIRQDEAYGCYTAIYDSSWGVYMIYLAIPTGVQMFRLQLLNHYSICSDLVETMLNQWFGTVEFKQPWTEIADFDYGKCRGKKLTKTLKNYLRNEFDMFYNIMNLGAQSIFQAAYARYQFRIGNMGIDAAEAMKIHREEAEEDVGFFFGRLGKLYRDIDEMIDGWEKEKTDNPNLKELNDAFEGLLSHDKIGAMIESLLVFYIPGATDLLKKYVIKKFGPLPEVIMEGKTYLVSADLTMTKALKSEIKARGGKIATAKSKKIDYFIYRNEDATFEDATEYERVKGLIDGGQAIHVIPIDWFKAETKLYLPADN